MALTMCSIQKRSGLKQMVQQMARVVDRSVLDAALSLKGAPSSDYDLNGFKKPDTPAKLKIAGVLVAFVERDAGLSIILTKRASHLAHHPGQIAFPGGRAEESDVDVADTALREAQEEIGLPRNSVEILGLLPPHDTVTNYAMTPVLAWVNEDFSPSIDESEVAEYFEVPANFVLDRANFQIQSRRWRGAWRSYYTVAYGPYYIWGATARVLFALAERISP